MLKKISNWYFSRKALPYWCILSLDCIIIIIAGYAGMIAQLGRHAFALNFWQISLTELLCLGPFCIAFRIYHTYSGILRYSSFIDLTRVLGANVSALVLIAILAFAGKVMGIENTVLVAPDFDCLAVQLVVGTLGMWAIRVIVRRMYDYYGPESSISVAIYGLKGTGVDIAQSLINASNRKYSVDAFISDDPSNQGAFVMGKKVYIRSADIVSQLAENRIRGIVVSPMKMEAFRTNNELIDQLIEHGIKIIILGGDQEWDGKSELSVGQLREVDIEDLLPRDKIEVDMDSISSQLHGKRILITGAAGSIGSEIVRQVATFAPDCMILIDQAESPLHDVRLMMKTSYPDISCHTIVTDICKGEHMERIFSRFHPQYVFHAAAYKHVPMMEDDPAIAVQNNIRGTRVIADLAVKYGAEKFVMISTDKAVNPTNVMGCSKRICEIYCQSLSGAIQEGKVEGKTQFVTTRFGNVLGSNGSVIPIFREQIRRGGPVTVTHKDIIRYFMIIPEACKLVLEAAVMGKGGEIYAFDMGKPVRIVKLAKRMIALSGARNIDIVYTGLRDGEKLYEEILSDKEDTIPTSHPKIMAAKVRQYDYATASANEERLFEVSHSFDDMKIVAIMKEIVPEYKSKQSKYEALDAV